jgi:predicted metal-dependent enzyme (double-stranded beta helix superfamily)
MGIAMDLSSGGLEILGPFVEAARALWLKELSDEERWRQMGLLLPMLLDSAALRERALAWPAPGTDSRRAQNLLFYEDPDYHFVINGLVKRPGTDTPIHDHAHTWTVYGVLSGQERVVRFKRTDDGLQRYATIEPIDDYMVAPGYVDVVPPGLLHAEYAGDERTVAVIVRSERVGGFPQKMVDLQTHLVTEAPGPEQVPYRL